MKARFKPLLDHIEQHGMLSPKVLAAETNKSQTSISESLCKLGETYVLSKKKIKVLGVTHTVTFITPPTKEQIKAYTMLIMDATKPTHSQLSPEINDVFKRAWV